MNIIGIDIGTTTICVTVIDSESGKSVKTVTVDSNSFLPSAHPYEKMQSPEKIEATVFSHLRELADACAPIGCIGVTGQMHGIVYINAAGLACSPLYTWQDTRANEKTSGSRTYCDVIREQTGYRVPAGYGLASHYFNLRNGLVPEEAVTFCTIHDYIAMRLCGNRRAVMHVSDAASFGLFDAKNARFDLDAAAALGIDVSMLPDVTEAGRAIGTWCGIPVSCAIGDNQASFFGSVSDTEHTVLVNIGTGSQISVRGSFGTDFPSGEVRPLSDGDYILVGSALCGGRAYACLERFFRDAFARHDGSEEKAYAFMDAIAEESYPLPDPVRVDTAFSGTRTNPDARGSITNLSIDNFTPAQLICGVLQGAARELYDMYAEIAPALTVKPTMLVGSGNGLRKSPVWRRMTEDLFGMKMQIPAHREEAAYGAAIFAMAACGLVENIKEAQHIIQYLV